MPCLLGGSYEFTLICMSVLVHFSQNTLVGVLDIVQEVRGPLGLKRDNLIFRENTSCEENAQSRSKNDFLDFQRKSTN